MTDKWWVEDRWNRFWRQHLKKEPPNAKLLIGGWTSPGRHYHTLYHVRECLDLLDFVTMKYRGYRADYTVVELALWFHDLIYVPGDKDNERRSADIAGITLAGNGIEEEICVAVHDAIMATRHSSDVTRYTSESALVVDIDLAILGSSSTRYERYVEDIRKEYSKFTDDEWRAGRIDVLRGFMKREKIYQTALCDYLEPTARCNIGNEIAKLQSFTPTHDDMTKKFLEKTRVLVGVSG